MRRSEFNLRVLFILLLSLSLGCPRAKEEEAKASVPVRVAKVIRQTIAATLNAAGPLQPPPGADVKLGALVIGRLSEVLVAEGDHVVGGQVLARIESTPFKDVLHQAQAQLALTRVQKANDARKLERAQKLFNAGIAARQEVDDAQAQAAASEAAVRTALAALSTAQNQLNRSELKAPFDGVVAHVFAAAGEPTDGSGKPLLEVTRAETLEVHAVVAARDAEGLKPGQKAEVRVGSLKRSWPAEVVAVSPLLDAATGTATVRIRVANGEGQLKGGEMAQARIVLSTHPSALTVPEEALLSDPGEAAAPASGGGGGKSARVETVDAKGRALQKTIQVGVRTDGRAEVLEGLAEGEQVVVQGGYALPDGALLKIEGGAP